MTEEITEKRAQAQARMAKARAVRQAKLAARGVEVTETTREQETKSEAGIRGRDGEVLTRKRSSQSDPFFIPPELIDDGWEMQWIAHSVVGQKEIVQDQLLGMLENAWRPVPATRKGFSGKYMPVGATGHIVRGQQGLYERPKALSDQARAEDLRAAHQLVSDRNEALKLTGLRKGMAPGFEMRQGRGDVRLSIDPNLDGQIPRPSYDLAKE